MKITAPSWFADNGAAHAFEAAEREDDKAADEILPWINLKKSAAQAQVVARS